MVVGSMTCLAFAAVVVLLVSFVPNCGQTASQANLTVESWSVRPWHAFYMGSVHGTYEIPGSLNLTANCTFDTEAEISRDDVVLYLEIHYPVGSLVGVDYRPSAYSECFPHAARAANHGEALDPRTAVKVLVVLGSCFAACGLALLCYVCRCRAHQTGSNIEYRTL